MKKFLIGLVIVVVGMALGVGASLGAAALVSKAAAQRLTAGAAPAQSFRSNREDANKMGPGMQRNGMYSDRSDPQLGGVVIRNWERFGGHGGRGMPGPCWNGNQNGQNSQNNQNPLNNQNGQKGGCLNMGPGNRGPMPYGRGWPRR